MARWVKALSAADKDAYLLRFLAEEGDVLLRAELSKRFREATAPRKKGRARADGRRTVAQLLAARDALTEEKSREAAERAARERAQYLDQLALREPDRWREVGQLIATRRPKDHDLALSLLVDLRDLADRSGRTEEAAKRIRELRQRLVNKPSLLKRFEEKLGR